jgi:hypothetical protein
MNIAAIRPPTPTACPRRPEVTGLRQAALQATQKNAAGLSGFPGSFDFGVTERGDWEFFEYNPNGQLLWMELKTGFELARRVAQILLEHHNSNPEHSLGVHM